MNLGVQVQHFGVLAHADQNFHFQKIQGVLKNIFLCVKIDMKLPFTLKNKRKKKVRNWSFKTSILDPPI